MTGRAISHYRILEKLGEGGMGVVYKAEDTKLDRPVALKFLPAHLLGNQEVRKRFEREAKAAAALSHPNVCRVYEIDEAEGKTFIAMELIEGESLDKKIERGPLKLEEALSIAQQVAKSLEAAHKRGIIHRDIKPENIMVGEDGHVTIMDFGLAQLTEASRLTKTDERLGTVAYMSPEQTEGSGTDHRSDIWSLGVVLYEMVTGQQPFKGDYDRAVMYSILNEQPEPITALRTGIPMELEVFVGKCLAKQAADRYESTSEIEKDLRRLGHQLVSGSARAASEKIRTLSSTESSSRRRPAWSIVAVVLVTLVGFLQWRVAPEPQRDRVDSVLRLKVEPPGAVRVTSRFAVSPDATRLVYLGNVDDNTYGLFLHDFRDESNREVDRVGVHCYPFWSRDSRYLAYADGQELKKIDLQSGIIQTLCALPGSIFRGGSWEDDGNIIFSVQDSTSGGIFRLTDAGGSPELWPGSENPDGGRFADYWPEVVGGSGRFAFWRASEREARLAEFDSVESRTLIESDSGVRFAASGHLVFERAGALQAVRVDPNSLEFTSGPAALSSVIHPGLSSGRPNFSVSDVGLAAYLKPTLSQLSWVDRSGANRVPLGEPDDYVGFVGMHDMRVSPNAREVAVAKRNDGIWLLDSASGQARQLAPQLDRFDCRSPVWSPDLSQLACSIVSQSIVLLSLARGETAEPTSLGLSGVAMDWSPNGGTLLYRFQGDLFALDIDLKKAVQLTNTPFDEGLARFSPDGRWIAYVSDETASREVYIRRFLQSPALSLGPPRQVSRQGGDRPAWSQDESELFFVQGDLKLVAQSVSLSDESFALGSSQELFGMGPFGQFDTLDGKRFLVRDAESEEAWLNVILNWESLVQ